jgi:hypothetical protein
MISNEYIKDLRQVCPPEGRREALLKFRVCHISKISDMWMPEHPF